MENNNDPWWENDSSNQKNVFTGDVGSISTSPTLSYSPPNPTDPNKFIMSQFLTGLLLIPIFAGAMMSLTVLLADQAGSDLYYHDYHYNEFDSGSTIISGNEYNTWSVTFDIPEINLEVIDKNDYWFSTEFSVWSNEDWGYCYFDNDGFESPVESSDGNSWYPMDCEGQLDDSNSFFMVNSRTFTYATDSNLQPDSASVDGDTDPDISFFILSLLPFLIPIIYFLLLIWSFVKKKKSLGFGLIGGIVLAPISFCFSMIFFAFLFWEIS